MLLDDDVPVFVCFCLATAIEDAVGVCPREKHGRNGEYVGEEDEAGLHDETVQPRVSFEKSLA